ncbi:MAG: hypothetical protein ABJM06_00690 [Gilvibacter sp.]
MLPRTCPEACAFRLTLNRAWWHVALFGGAMVVAGMLAAVIGVPGIITFAAALGLSVVIFLTTVLTLGVITLLLRQNERFITANNCNCP